MDDSSPKVIGRYGKQPAEVVPPGRWGIDFTPDMVDGETIIAATITVTRDGGPDDDDLVAGEAAIDSGGHRVTTEFSGGVSPVDYHVQVLATGSTGAVYDGDFVIVVREV